MIKTQIRKVNANIIIPLLLYIQGEDFSRAITMPSDFPWNAAARHLIAQFPRHKNYLGMVYDIHLGHWKKQYKWKVYLKFEQ